MFGGMTLNAQRYRLGQRQARGILDEPAAEFHVANVRAARPVAIFTGDSTVRAFDERPLIHGRPPIVAREARIGTHAPWRSAATAVGTE